MTKVSNNNLNMATIAYLNSINGILHFNIDGQDIYYARHRRAEHIITHYENMPMQYTVFAAEKKMKISPEKKKIFSIFSLKTYCGYTLEPPRRGGSNEYLPCMFWIKNKKIRYTPANLSFSI